MDTRISETSSTISSRLGTLIVCVWGIFSGLMGKDQPLRASGAVLFPLSTQGARALISLATRVCHTLSGVIGASQPPHHHNVRMCSFLLEHTSQLPVQGLIFHGGVETLRFRDEQTSRWNSSFLLSETALKVLTTGWATEDVDTLASLGSSTTSLSQSASTGIGVTHCRTGLPSMMDFWSGNKVNGK